MPRCRMHGCHGIPVQDQRYCSYCQTRSFETCFQCNTLTRLWVRTEDTHRIECGGCLRWYFPGVPRYDTQNVAVGACPMLCLNIYGVEFHVCNMKLKAGERYCVCCYPGDECLLGESNKCMRFSCSNQRKGHFSYCDHCMRIPLSLESLSLAT